MKAVIVHFPEVLLIIWMLVMLSTFALTIWSVIDVARHDFVKKENKVVWLLICLLVGMIGPIIYLTQRKKLLAKFQPAGFQNDQYERLDLDGRRPEREERTRGDDEEDQLV